MSKFQRERANFRLFGPLFEDMLPLVNQSKVVAVSSVQQLYLSPQRNSVCNNNNKTTHTTATQSVPLVGMYPSKVLAKLISIHFKILQELL